MFGVGLFDFLSKTPFHGIVNGALIFLIGMNTRFLRHWVRFRQEQIRVPLNFWVRRTHTFGLFRPTFRLIHQTWRSPFLRWGRFDTVITYSSFGRSLFNIGCSWLPTTIQFGTTLARFQSGIGIAFGRDTIRGSTAFKRFGRTTHAPITSQTRTFPKKSLGSSSRGTWSSIRFQFGNIVHWRWRTGVFIPQFLGQKLFESLFWVNNGDFFDIRGSWVGFYGARFVSRVGLGPTRHRCVYFRSGSRPTRLIFIGTFERTGIVLVQNVRLRLRRGCIRIQTREILINRGIIIQTLWKDMLKKISLKHVYTSRHLAIKLPKFQCISRLFFDEFYLDVIKWISRSNSGLKLSKDDSSRHLSLESMKE